MDNSASYLNNIQSSVASNQNVLNMKQKAEDYKKAGLDWWKEPAEILGSQMAEGSLRHMGGSVLKKVGAKTGSQALTNLGSDIQSGKDIRKSVTSATKAIGQEATETAQSKLEQAGDLMRSRLTNKVPLSLDEQRASIRAQVLKSKKGRTLMRQKKKIEEPKRQLNKRQTIEQKSREGRASNFDESLSKPMNIDPFTGEEVLPKSKAIIAEPPQPVIDPDTGKELQPAEDIIAEQQRKYDPDNPLDQQILDATETEKRARSTIAETKKSASQTIQDLKDKLNPFKKTPVEPAKGTPEDPIQLNPFEIEPSFDPTAKLEGEFSGGGSFTGAGGQKITAGEYTATKEQLKTLEQSDKATKVEDFPKQTPIPKENLPTAESDLDKKQVRWEKLKSDYNSLSNDSKKSYGNSINEIKNKGLDKGDLETRETLMSQVKSQDTGGLTTPPSTGTKSDETTQDFQSQAESTDQSNKEIVKTDEDSENIKDDDDDPVKEEIPVEDEVGLGLSDLADPLIGVAGLGLALAPLFEGKPSAPSPPPQSALLNPATQMGDT